MFVIFVIIVIILLLLFCYYCYFLYFIINSKENIMKKEWILRDFIICFGHGGTIFSFVNDRGLVNVLGYNQDDIH